MAKEKKLYGLGRRKTAVARVLLVSKGKDDLINEKSLSDYFTTVAMKQAALAPLVLTSSEEEYSVKARVSGGGKQAQADAVKLGVARALVGINSDWRKQLKDAGMLTRDPRSKERKKPGLKRARRAPQFSKR